MSVSDAQVWLMLQSGYGFIGNSLLKPMSQTSTAGLDPAFWADFPDFDDARVAAAIQSCAQYAQDALEAQGAQTPQDAQAAQNTQDAADADFAKAVQDVSVEYTRLFVGPPEPAAAPWETLYAGEDITAGFGKTTFEMRELLREAGLQLSNQNNQYEDHMGIELLYLSELCRRASIETSDSDFSSESSPDSISDADTNSSSSADEVARFSVQMSDYIADHPLAWIAAFRTKVEEAAPDGYFARLLALAEALLCRHRAMLEEVRAVE